MSWQGDMIKRYEKAITLGVDTSDVDEELEQNEGWWDEESALTLMDCLIEHIGTNNQ